MSNNIDSLVLDPLEEAMLTASMRHRMGDPKYELDKLDKIMYLAGKRAKEKSPPVIMREYADDLKLGLVYN